MLIDSSVSHNFISRRVAEELKLKVVDTQPYLSELGGRTKEEDQWVL